MIKISRQITPTQGKFSPSKQMLLDHIILRNFRNYIDCEINFTKPVILIIGGNAQGKTSLLEAIYFLCTAESHRATHDAELIRHHESGFYLKGILRNGSDDVTSLEATKRVRGQFKLKKNGVLQTKRSEWIGQFNAVLFSPESLTLVKGSPSERRRFLDLLISQIDTEYLKSLQEYNFVLKQRNELLKQIRATLANSAQLDAWDKLLLMHGTAVIIKRLEIFHQLRNHAIQNHHKLTGGSENIALTYRSASVPNDTLTNNIENSNSENFSTNILTDPAHVSQKTICEDKVIKHFGVSLNGSREVDLQRGTTLVGPHRDDFLIELENEPQTSPVHNYHDDRDSDLLAHETETFREVARSYGSQGQQRTIALALKLAELELIRHLTGRNPIVLLDDVTSELDDNRIGYLLEVLQDLSAQTFITATDAEPLVNHLNQPSVLKVENAQISSTTETIENS
ncbi:DNA replication/repair protein RecF [Candidatus Poribacteria bacterium]|nr:DNA replication/repair protein RecF [Candidatus Poribacteria bacterium]